MRWSLPGFLVRVAPPAFTLLLAVWLPGAAYAGQPGDDPVRILGFRREAQGPAVALVVTASRPIAFNYASTDLQTIVLELPGVDPRGVTPPGAAWGPEVASVELTAQDDASGPVAVLRIGLDHFEPYTIRSIGNELRIVLGDSTTQAIPPAPAPAREPEPAPVATPEPVSEPPLAATPREEPRPASEPPPPTETTTATTDPYLGVPVQPLPAAPPAEAEPAPVAPDFLEDAPDSPITEEPAPAAEPAPATGPVPAPDLPAAPPAATATRILQVEQVEREGNLAIRIPADGRPSYQAFFTEEGPERLVLDFEGTESRPLFQNLSVDVGPVRRVRVGQHAADPVPVVRVVVELTERVPHRIEIDDGGVTIVFDGVAPQ